MDTFCSNCGKALTADNNFCPQCGKPTSFYYSDAGSLPHEPTALASSVKTPPQIPSTGYGSNPYGVSLSNPYEISPVIPPPPPPERRKKRFGVFIAISLLCIIILAGGTTYLLTSRNQGKQISSSNSSSSGTALTQAHETATANANIQATATAIARNNAQATATVIAANADPYPDGGQLRLIDPLRDNATGVGWDVGSDNVGLCSFSNAAYHVSSNHAGYFNDCFERSITFQNFVVEVQMSIVQGDCGGILFRANPGTSQFYRWEVCRGTWNFYAYFNSSGGVPSLENGTFSYQATNTLAVAANGSQITLYINGQQVNSFTNTSFIVNSVNVRRFLR